MMALDAAAAAAAYVAGGGVGSWVALFGSEAWCLPPLL